MILFILIAVGIAIYTIFADGCLIDCINSIEKINKEIKERIEHGQINWDSFSYRKYNEHDYDSIPKNILYCVLLNIMLNATLNFLIVLLISAIIVGFFPKEESYYSFNINSLKDNIVTNGEIHGGAFCVRGSIDGEISYFYSRVTDKGEIIEHIPANKSYIKYDDNKTPCIEVHQKNHKVPEFFYKLLFAEWCNNKSIDYYVIIVPNGTISMDGTYEIDMK